MDDITERAERIAGWILRREGMLKAARLPKVLVDMLTEQKAIDIDKAWEWIEGWVFENASHDVFDELMSSREEYIKAMEK